MKHCYLLLVLVFASHLLSAQTIADGYFVSLNNDTVLAEVKVPKTIFAAINNLSLERKIKVTDSSKESFEKFKPDEIRAFAFFYKDKEYSYASKELKGHRKFFETLFSGGKANLYFYYAIDNLYPPQQYSGRRCDTYIIEKRDGNQLLLTNLMTRRKMRKKLKAFFENEAGSSDIVDSASISTRHLKDSLKEIVETLNNSSLAPGQTK